MKQRCETCGRPLLNSDPQCFHCGTPVPGREPPAGPAVDQTVDLGSASRCLGVVLGLMVLGVLLTSWMGAAVRTAAGGTPTPSPPTGWREFTPERGDYSIWLPNSWRLYTPGTSGWEAHVATMASPLPSSFSQIEPSRAADRVSLVALRPAAAGDRPPIVSVDCHPGLAATDLALLQGETWSVGGAALDRPQEFAVGPHASGEPALIAELVYSLADESPALHTLTMVIKTNGGVCAISASAEEAGFWRQEQILRQILESFRPLDAGLEAQPRSALPRWPAVAATHRLSGDGFCQA